MNVVVNGLMTNYQKVGSGKKVIVFLPGWADTSASFSKLIEHLQAKYTVLALDLPGFGGTQAPPNAWGLEDYAEFVAAWLKKIDIKDVGCLIGHSYGGATSIIGLGNGLLKADKLVLLASAGVRNQRKTRKSLLLATSKAAKIPLYLLPHRQRQKLRAKFYKFAGSDMLLLPHMELTFKRIINEDVQSAAGSVAIPTLLIYGTKDKDALLSYGRLLHKAIKNSNLEVIAGAGHFLHQEQPEHIASMISDFLEGKADV